MVCLRGAGWPPSAWPVVDRWADTGMTPCRRVKGRRNNAAGVNVAVLMVPFRRRLLSFWPYVLGSFVVVQIATLYAMGVPWVCACGVKLWEGGILNGQTSQHVADWYTPSHMVHGMVFYMLLRWGFPKWQIPFVVLGATAMEIAWEIFENTPWVVERYRTATAASDYSGDTVLNSVADVGFMLLGFLIAWKWPFKWVIALVIGFELLALWMIRDNLMLQIVTFIWPIDGLVDWQSRA